jgi:hypothetical protein
MAQAVTNLPSKHKALSSKLQYHQEKIIHSHILESCLLLLELEKFPSRLLQRFLLFSLQFPFKYYVPRNSLPVPHKTSIPFIHPINLT